MFFFNCSDTQIPIGCVLLCVYVITATYVYTCLYRRNWTFRRNLPFILLTLRIAQDKIMHDDITTSPYFRKINNGYYLNRRGQLVFGRTDPYTWTKTTNSEKLTVEDFANAFELSTRDVLKLPKNANKKVSGNR